MNLIELIDKKPKCFVCKIVMLLIIIFIFTGSDLLVKEAAYQNLRSKPDVVVIPGFWSYHYIVNDDIGFSILSWLRNYLDTKQKWMFLVALQGFGTLVVIGFYFYSKTFKYIIPLALIVSGALGNVIDRIIRGYVIDYVMWYYKGFTWPIFNLADSFTVVGACLLLVVLIFFSKDEPVS